MILDIYGAITAISDCNRTRAHNHLVHKQTLNHLAKWTILQLKLAILQSITGITLENLCYTQEHLYKNFISPDHTGLLNDVLFTLTDKTDGSGRS